MQPHVLIVGAGFAGVGMGATLKRAGHDAFTIVERADRVGGVWRENTYPGAACDVPSHMYSFSFAPKHDWSRRFSPGPEILAYLDECVDRFGLREHLRLSTTAEEATWDAERRRWHVRLGDGEVISADVLVPGLGQLAEPALPRLPGLERFAGPAFHSARWDHDVPLAGRRVTVIGTGASAIQFVPEIAPQTEHLTIVQRSAPWVIPKVDGGYSPAKRRLYERLPAAPKAVRLLWWGYGEVGNMAFMRFPEAIARAIAPGMRGLATAQRRIQLRGRPELQRAVTPEHEMGCKRVLITNDWYRALRRDDVTLETGPIAEITARGLRLADGREIEADVLIHGTGFRATEFLAPLTVRGRDVRDLLERWAGSASAHLGLTVPGFPNMFLLYGPNTNLGFGSIVYMLESQFRYVSDALRHLRTGGAELLEVRDDVHARSDAVTQERLRRSVWTAACGSWYVNDAGRNTNNWPGWVSEYRRATRRIDVSEFHTTAPASAPVAA